MFDFKGWVDNLDAVSMVVSPASFVANVGADVLNIGEKDPSRARDRGDDARQTWDKDRDGLTTELTDLDKQFLAGDGKFDPAAVKSHEAFEVWKHQEIRDKVDSMTPAQINDAADGWRALTKSATTAVDNFHANVAKAISGGWEGASAESANTSIAQYVDKTGELPIATQMIANGLDYSEGYLQQTQSSVPPVPKSSLRDKVMDHVPLPGVWKESQHEADELEEYARTVMTSVYRPGVDTVDTRTPVIPQAFNPVVGPPPSNPTDFPSIGPSVFPGGPVTPGGPSSPSIPSFDPKDTGVGPSDVPGGPSDGTNPLGPDNGATNPAGVDPSALDPSKLDPSNLDPSKLTGADPLGTHAAAAHLPNGGSASGLGGSGLGSGGAGLGAGGLGSAGLGGSGSGAAALTNPTLGNGSLNGLTAGGPGVGGSAAGAAGRAGAGGMSAMPHGAKGKGDEDKEHKSPGYLVNVDNGNELIGDLPRVAPPVIGG